MATGTNKKIFAKKDMNFFEEFTASAAKAQRVLTYAILFGFCVVGIIIAVIVYGVIRNSIIKSDITKITDELATEKYATVELEAEQLAETFQDKNNYYYALTQMKATADKTPTVSMELPDLIAENIPSDSWIDNYTITGETLAMTGYSFTYYSAADMVNMLNDSDVFTSMPIINVTRVAANEIGSAEDIAGQNGGTTNIINNYYLFDVTGTLLKDVYVSVGRYLDGDVISSISGIETMEKPVGETYELTGLATYEAGGVTYVLARITVDGVEVDAESFTAISNADSLAKVANANCTIALYYVTADQAAAAAETTAAEG